MTTRNTSYTLFLLIMSLLLFAFSFTGAALARVSHEARCSQAIAQGLSSVHRSVSSDAQGHLKKHQKNKLETSLQEAVSGSKAKGFEYLPGGDRATRLNRVEQACQDPSISFTTDMNALAVSGALSSERIWNILFGSIQEENVATRTGDRDLAKCQSSALKHGDTCHRKQLKVFRRCQARAARTGSDAESCIEEAASYSCNLEDKIQRSCRKSLSAGVRSPSSQSPSPLFPGCDQSTHSDGAGQCIQAAISCQTCSQMNASLQTSVSCDQIDDGEENGSCAAMPNCASNPVGSKADLADGGRLQLDCPYIPNTTATDNVAASSSSDDSFALGTFAWNTFAALNWPTDTTNPDRRGFPYVSDSRNFRSVTGGTVGATCTDDSDCPGSGNYCKNDPTKTPPYTCQQPVKQVLVWETFKEKREVFYQGTCSHYGSQGEIVRCAADATCNAQTEGSTCILYSPPYSKICTDSGIGCRSDADCAGDTCMTRGGPAGSLIPTAELAHRPSFSEDWEGELLYSPMPNVQACESEPGLADSDGGQRTFMQLSKGSHYPNSLDETIEVNSQALEDVAQLCAGQDIRYCSDSAMNLSCTSDSDCVSPSTCIAVQPNQFEEYCKVAFDTVCSGNVSIRCSTDSDCEAANSGVCETITISNGLSSEQAPPFEPVNNCCHVALQKVKPRVWDGIPNTTIGYDPKTSTVEPNALFYEVKVNFDYFDYVTRNDYDLNEILTPAARANQFLLPWRSSATQGGTPSTPGTRNPNRLENYSSQSCLMNNGASRTCQNASGTSTASGYVACHSDEDCTTAGETCEAYANTEPPCRQGSIQTKAAWKLLDASDEAENQSYFTTQAQYYASDEDAVSGVCYRQGTFGLVGLHIIQRTHQLYPGQPEPTDRSLGGSYIFATWEHQGNFKPDGCELPAEAGNPGMKCDGRSGYYYTNLSQALGTATEPENAYFPDVTKQPECMTNGVCSSDESMSCETDTDCTFAIPLTRVSVSPYKGDPKASPAIQATEWFLPSEGTKTLNASVHEELGCKDSSSVWCNYHLVGIQFAGANLEEYPSTILGDASDAENSPQQDYYLANLVIETNLGLQEFRGLPPGIVPTNQYAAQPYTCVNDPSTSCDPSDNAEENQLNTTCGELLGAVYYLSRPPPMNQLCVPSNSTSRYPGTAPGEYDLFPLPYNRQGHNMRASQQEFNMGGCMGCHGVAQTTGYSYSFTAREGQGGATPDTVTDPGPDQDSNNLDVSFDREE